jgi:hypothetical protein
MSVTLATNNVGAVTINLYGLLVISGPSIRLRACRNGWEWLRSSFCG